MRPAVRVQENGRQCSQRQNGVCIEEKISKTCTVKTCRDVSLECGEQSFCLDGECYVPTPETSDDFDQAAASLAGVSEAAKGLGDPPRIFTGTPMKCSKKALGMPVLQRRRLGHRYWSRAMFRRRKSARLAKEKGLTIYWRVLRRKNLGKCIRKRAYCRYDSCAKSFSSKGRWRSLVKPWARLSTQPARPLRQKSSPASILSTLTLPSSTPRCTATLSSPTPVTFSSAYKAPCNLNA